MVPVSVMDCFEFRSIYFASVLDQRHMIPPEKKVISWHFFMVVFISQSTYTRAEHWSFFFSVLAWNNITSNQSNQIFKMLLL